MTISHPPIDTLAHRIADDVEVTPELVSQLLGVSIARANDVIWHWNRSGQLRRVARCTYRVTNPVLSRPRWRLAKRGPDGYPDDVQAVSKDLGISVSRVRSALVCLVREGVMVRPQAVPEPRPLVRAKQKRVEPPPQNEHEALELVLGELEVRDGGMGLETMVKLLQMPKDDVRALARKWGEEGWICANHPFYLGPKWLKDKRKRIYGF